MLSGQQGNLVLILPGSAFVIVERLSGPGTSWTCVVPARVSYRSSRKEGCHERGAIAKVVAIARWYLDFDLLLVVRRVGHRRSCV
jgi:hypothetical protein